MFLPAQTKIEEDAVHDGQTCLSISNKQNPRMLPSWFVLGQCETNRSQGGVWGEIFCHQDSGTILIKEASMGR
jgi:hypothetical protein